MSEETAQQMAARVAALMGQRLHVAGDGLSEKLARGGKRLPRRVRAAAQELADAAAMEGVPKLQQQIDPQRLMDARDVCLRYLGPLGQGARRWGWFLGTVAQVAAGLMAVAAAAWVLAR
jgi:hypothetical protein